MERVARFAFSIVCLCLMSGCKSDEKPPPGTLSLENPGPTPVANLKQELTAQVILKDAFKLF